uniref:1,3-beta-glucan synthase n=1 Tax=Aegilops tauschii subsp. strangulata TaxID=200361 RepID=A0A453QDB6_AEGTS
MASSMRRRPSRGGGGPGAAAENWERLVRAALKRDRAGGAGASAAAAHAGAGAGLASAVPPSLGRTTNIEQILQAADDIEDDDPNVARILCEQAYSMAQNLDPSSDGRGVLQFKTGLASVIKQKLAKKDGGSIDRQNDIEVLWNFYLEYKKRRRVDDMQREQEIMRESGTFSTEMGARAMEMKKIYATLRALLDVLEILVGQAPSDRLGRQILEEIKKIKRSDAALRGELMPYNIIPLDASSVGNVVGFFPEVRAAIAAIQNCEDLPRFPYDTPQLRQKDIFDLLQYVFGFQDDNVRNQRENVALTLANAQSRLSLPNDTEPKIDEKAVTEVFCKVLDNYIKWCRFLGKRVAWTSLEAVNKNRKIILVALYFLIWGEAANVRFLPECLCYIFHNMAKELDGILDSSEAEPAKSCVTNDGSTSYLEKIITPIYLTMSAEANNNNDGKAAHSAWRNYDDFNEYFWSRSCFELSWPPAENSKFLRKPAKRKRCLTIIAFHHGKINISTIKVVLSAGPAFFILNFIECCLDVLLMFGAYKTARGFAISRLVIRFLWLAAISTFVTYLYVYVIFWLVIFACKFPFAYYLQIRPLVVPTNIIVQLHDLQYSWHDFVSKGNRNALTILSLWAPVVAIYLMDIHIWYTLLSALVGGVMGARGRLGEIRSIEMLHKRFESFPEAFAKTLSPQRISSRPVPQDSEAATKMYASIFSPFWNEIIKSLREEDYISNREMDLLMMPSNCGTLRLVQWPLFLLTSKIMLANDYASDCKDSQKELWHRISKDEYMAYAVKECYYSAERILKSIVDGEGKLWVDRLFQYLNESIGRDSLLVTINLKKLQLVQSRLTGLTGLLIRDETADRKAGVTKALRELYEVVTHEFLAPNLREEFDTWQLLLRARNDGRLFSNILWPNDLEMKEQVKRLHLLLTVKDSAANIPKNLEAQRRLQFFTNSLFMDMPEAKPVSEMIPFCVFTPYYSETVLYSMSELCVDNEDGISILFYLQKIFPDEWANFLERIGRGESSEEDFKESPSDTLELRFWVSYRGQTLARTVRGMMYYRRALMLQSYLEKRYLGGIEDGYSALEYIDTQGYQLSPDARAQADLKFTYVVSCQIYGQQKQRKAPEAADIALLLQRNEALRVAFIHEEDGVSSDGQAIKEYHSKLVKADIHGKDQEIYSIKLPGNPKLGEGKPENQNHAIIFTRGDAIQTIDMNQDNYLEEAMKVRNLLEEFRGNHGIRYPTILGVREHVFTGSVSSLASFMSKQETSFVTLGQRVLAYLKVRMHYGHPDVFDRIFHITRGGISKASRVINISEDIYAGFNSTLRQGNITHHEYIQVGKGRDVGLNQIALFEGKVAGGNGEQVLSRDVYRLGQLFDFFRMLTFFYTTVGYYVCTMMTVLTVYIFLYGRVYLALSGLDHSISRQARFLGNTALDAALNAQFLVQIGVFTAVPMIMGFILELGLMKAIFSFITMQLQFCSVFFTFSLGTRTHYFGRTILHGGAKYRATGRGFVVRHIKFADNYRLYSRSHFVKALEVALLLIVYIAYGYTKGGSSSFILLTISSWIMVISWLFAPYIFNPSGFEWQKTVEDFDDWTNWLFYKGGVGVKGENSWESWWEEEQAHIQTFRGRILETILSLRFLLFQYGIVYKLKITAHNTSLAMYGFSWIVLLVMVLLFKLFTATPRKSTALPIFIRFLQGLLAIGIIAAIACLIGFTDFTIADLFASALAFLATGWCILCLAITWKRVVKTLGLWDSVREISRMYDAGMGAVIFAPIVFFSWFPFVSTFQSRILFNQAFSRGLEISLILAGNKANQES